MRNEERWPMYFAIRQQKEMGLNKSQVARNLNIARNTVIKFWNMTLNDYKTFTEGLETRSKKLEIYEPEIVGWLREYPDLSAAQVMDWLKERHECLNVAESTVRNYVREIRLEYGIPKAIRIRHYEAVVELPMGKQMQVDFGETKLRNSEGHTVKLWLLSPKIGFESYPLILLS